MPVNYISIFNFSKIIEKRFVSLLNNLILPKIWFSTIESSLKYSFCFYLECFQIEVFNLFLNYNNLLIRNFMFLLSNSKLDSLLLLFLLFYSFFKSYSYLIDSSSSYFYFNTLLGYITKDFWKILLPIKIFLVLFREEILSIVFLIFLFENQLLYYKLLLFFRKWIFFFSKLKNFNSLNFKHFVFNEAFLLLILFCYVFKNWLLENSEE